MAGKVIRVSGKRFIDDKGRDFVPYGINMVCKDRTVGCIGNYTEEEFKFLKENGFNLVRLGLQWCMAEPVPGVYSEDYFSKIDRIISLAAAHEIPVFLDMHQDLYGAKFEDGAPEWATVDEGAEHVRTELWSESYLVSPAVQLSFDNFWKDAPAADGVGVRTRFVSLWKFIAARYCDNPYVIGYDVFNEPFPGTVGGEVALILNEFMQGGVELSNLEDQSTIMNIVGKIMPITASFETGILNPFYDEVGTAIRSVDKDTILILESNYFANAGIPSEVQPACYPDGRQIENQAWAPHGYDILVDTSDYETGGTERVDFIFGSLLEKADSLDIPCFFGEWGCYPNASTGQKEQARHLLELFKRAGVGQTYYDHSHIHDGGILEVLKR